MLRFRTVLGSVVLAALLTGCPDEPITPLGGGGAGGGGDIGGGGSGGGYDGPCTVLSLGDTSLYFESVARVGLQAPVLPPVEDLAKTRLTLELYEDDGSGVLPPLEAGTFQFATPPDDNYGTCQHCVLLVGFDLSGRPRRAFYPRTGTMTVDELPVDFSLVLKGKAEGMELVEVTQNEDFTWEVLPGGDCYYVESWQFDTEPVDGGACTSAEECPNEAEQICDPTKARCGEPQCSLTFDPPFCDEGEVCLSQLVDPDQQVTGPAIGACYRECTPGGTDCGDGSICRPLGPTQAFGICLTTGPGKIGDACTPRDITTGCEPGAVCTGEPGECARICDFLQEAAGCDEDRYCAVSNLCEKASTGDAAAIGDVCADSSPELVECGIEGDAFRGLCMKFFLEDPDLLCERLCRTEAPECPNGEECLGVFSNPVVGICRAPAVCGDDVLDVIGGEVCDDGNDVSGDGCTGDCTAAELDILCNAATPLTVDQDIQGTTEGGPSGYGSLCDPYLATRVATYSYLPPSAGRLRVFLDSGEDDLGLSVYGDCADAQSELGCRNFLGEDILDIDLDAAPTEPLLVIVRAASPTQTGDFTLRAEFTPADCGDGIAVGPEACDDGNETGGDGCSADCSTIEWQAVCDALPTLSTTAANTGTTTGAQDLFDLTGICSFVNGGGPERAFSFVAPSDGVLHLALSQPDANLSLYVQDGCGPASDETYVACSNFAWVGTDEMTSPELTEGQAVTVIVDSFTSSETGEFELTAEFEAR